MSFALTSEQLEFQNTLRHFFQERVTSAYLRSRIEGDAASDPKFLTEVENLGLTSYFGSQDQEARGGVRELFLVAFESGYSLVPEGLSEMLLSGPYLAGQLLPQKVRSSAPWNQLQTGSTRASCAAMTVFASKDGQLSAGRVDFVASAPSASSLVLADLERKECYRVSVSPSLFTTQQCLDESVKRFQIDLTAAMIEHVPGIGTQFIAAWNLTRAAEMAGACTRAIEMTLEYVKTRSQFEVPIGGFQAVQHGVADMFLAAESLSALCRFAAWAGDSSPSQFELASLAALNYACEVASPCIEKAIQLHGGIGFTWEYDLHLYLRRVKMLEVLHRPDSRGTNQLLELARVS